MNARPLLLGVRGATGTGTVPLFRFIDPDGVLVDAAPHQLAALRWLAALDAYDRKLIDAKVRRWRREAGAAGSSLGAATAGRFAQ
jgi:hypothetical protein